jgi:aconitate hydratase
MDLEILLKVGDNISTDEIMPAGQRVLPFRSNIPKIAEFVYWQVDDSYTERARKLGDAGHGVVAGHNYGQGSSREHAAIAPRYLGLRAVVAKSFARIHWSNLANFGILGLEFADDADYDGIEQGDVLAFRGLRESLRNGSGTVEVTNKDRSYTLRHRLTSRQVDMILQGGLIPVFKERLERQ